MKDPIDLTRAAVAPFEGAEPHRALSALAGAWAGATKLWLDPSAPPEEATLRLRAESILGGRWLRLTYQGIAFGKPHAGEMLIGFHRDAGEFEIAWVDSAHTGSSIMKSIGKPSERAAIDVLGGYSAGEQQWGWRTLVYAESAEVLRIEAHNVTPQGVEERAMEWRLERAESGR